MGRLSRARSFPRAINKQNRASPDERITWIAAGLFLALIATPAKGARSVLKTLSLGSTITLFRLRRKSS